MEDLLKGITGILSLLRKRYSFIEGLITTWILVWLGNFWLIKNFGPKFREVVKYIYPQAPSYIFLFLELGSYLIVFLGTLSIWLYKRRSPKFHAKEVGILFSSSFPPNVEEEAINLQAKVRDALKEKDLLNLIKIKVIPENIPIKDVQDAIGLTMKSKATLIVWGPFEESKIQGSDIAGFSKIHFSYTHPRRVTKQYHEDIGQSLIGKKWVYAKENELIEKQLVAENIAQVSLHIVGMSLLVREYLEEAESIFSVLDNDLERFRQKSDSPPYLREFCTQIRQK